jgi:hypothetical protein
MVTIESFSLNHVYWVLSEESRKNEVGSRSITIFVFLE